MVKPGGISNPEGSLTGVWNDENCHFDDQTLIEESEAAVNAETVMEELERWNDYLQKHVPYFMEVQP